MYISSPSCEGSPLFLVHLQIAHMSVSAYFTSQNIGAASTAFNQFNLATTGNTHPGIWVAGNFSTVRYCSAYGGAAKIVTTFPIDLPFEHYFCQTPDNNGTALQRTESLLQSYSVPCALVRAASTSAGEKRARATSWIGMGLASVSVLAWTCLLVMVGSLQS